MKKSALVIILIAFLLMSVSLILVSQLAKAQEEIPGLPSGLSPEDVEKTQEKIEGKWDYLKKEWGAILVEKKYIGPAVKFIDSALTFLNPLFKSVLGVEYSISWLFIFAVAIWIILFVFLLSPATAIFGKGILGFIASFAIVSLIGLSGVIRMAADLLSFAITNIWIAWISLAIAVIIMIIASKFGKDIKKWINEEKEKTAKQQQQKDREIVHTAAEVEKEKLEGYKKE